ncbi:MAG: molybdate ABC transporter substrate-binding protein [Spirochaetales bacterium]|uniref:Molybdate ABC transporter substrate-binding protein n=1 Tax=Candidatus Thalassospirochaeta sargassi TaxID=3119039 RepID=A0AAJ1IKM9_9SPIO|nr:molybdate ABC transporter substrate-binding protein [Spirochaetales bacterium]
MKRTLLLVILAAAATTGFAEGSRETNYDEITVFAAASTNDLLEEISGLYSSKTGTVVNLSPASSGTCAKQLEQGAHADIFISASEKWIAYTRELGLLNEQSKLMSNSLVLIAPKNSSAIPFTIKKASPVPVFEGRISIADPAHAPAGRYAVEAIQGCGWYDELENRILPGSDVRKAMSVVEFGETEFGIVYRTDAEKSSKVKIISEFPKETYSPIRYFCGLTAEAGEKGREFYSFLLKSPDAARLITNYGFNKRTEK